MSARHWRDDELVGHLYGVGPDDGHLEQCEECAGRWRDLQRERQRLLSPLPIAEESLARQRQAIHRRMEQSGRRWHWLPLLPATAAVVALAVVLYRPVAAPAPDTGPADAELLADVYSLVQSDEPRAVESMHGLFDSEGKQ